LLKTVGFHNLAAVFHLNTRYFAEEIKYIWINYHTTEAY
jgi:hypothetical protein